MCLMFFPRTKRMRVRGSFSLTPPGLIASHLAPETDPRSKNVEDFHESHFSSSDLSEAEQIIGKTNVFFYFHLKNQLLATIYTDSGPQNAPNACFK